jgi:hypothetical protein
VSRRDDLEAGLVEDGRWNLDQLAVYADYLHGRGDPRGELILLDLHGGPDVAERRGELLAQFLGEHATNPAIRSHLGFVDVDLDDRSDPALVARLGALAGYLREVRITGTADTIGAAVDALAITPRRWLTALAIRQRGIGPKPAINAKAGTALALATPRLDTLDVDGDGVFAVLEHAKVRVLGLGGISAIFHKQLAGVRELGLRIAERSDREMASAFTAGELPALRRLDLSWHQPPHDEHAFRFLLLTQLKPRLVEIRLPALRTPGDHANVQAAFRSMPRLLRVEIPPGPLALAHPTATIVDHVRAWRPLTRTMTAFAIDGTSHRVSLAEAADWLDAHHERMPDDARAAWDALWDVLLRKPRGRRAVPAEQLFVALAACHGHIWGEVYRALRAIDRRPGVVVPLL